MIFDPENGQVVALFLKPSGWLAREKVIVPGDILDMIHEIIVIRHSDQLVPPAEIIRLAQIEKSNTPILGQRAETESGESLGKVSDLLIDTSSWQISKYYLRKITSERILPGNAVQIITPRAVVFNCQSGSAQTETTLEPEVRTA